MFQLVDVPQGNIYRRTAYRHLRCVATESSVESLVNRVFTGVFPAEAVQFSRHAAVFLGDPFFDCFATMVPLYV